MGSRNTLAATANLLRIASKLKVDAACFVEYSCTRPPDDQVGDLRVGAAFCCQMSSYQLACARGRWCNGADTAGGGLVRPSRVRAFRKRSANDCTMLHGITHAPDGPY